MRHIRILAALLLLNIPLPLLAYKNLEMYTGDSQYVSCPSVNAIIYATSWASPSTSVSVVKDGEYGATIRVNNYFTGTVNVSCTYYYTIYSGNFPYSGSGTEYYFVKCKPIQTTLSKSELTLKVGGTYTLSASFSPYTSTRPTITWNSTNYGVASVSGSGVVKAVSPGKATIIAKSNAGPEVTCTVEVTEDPPTGITVTPSTLSLNKGDGYQLKASVSPSTASSAVTWDNTSSCISVSSTGYVRALAKGSASIKVSSAKAPSVFAKCSVTVTNFIKSLFLDKSILFIEPGKSFKLTASKSPSDADDDQLTWECSPAGVVTLTQDGGLTAVTEGNSTITVYSQRDRTIKATCQVVSVKPLEYASRPVPHIAGLSKSYTYGSYISFPDLSAQGLTWYVDGKVVSGPVLFDKGEHSLRAKVIQGGVIKESCISSFTIR